LWILIIVAFRIPLRILAESDNVSIKSPAHRFYVVRNETIEKEVGLRKINGTITKDYKDFSTDGDNYYSEH